MSLCLTHERNIWYFLYEMESTSIARELKTEKKIKTKKNRVAKENC